MLQDQKINIKFKLSALWAAATLCYAYGDILGFYQPPVVKGILEGKMGPLGSTSQALLLGAAVFMSIPCVMVALSLLLKPGLNRWLNIIFGLLNTLVMILTLFMDPWYYYIYMGIVEITLTSLIVWYAWKWPVQTV